MKRIATVLILATLGSVPLWAMPSQITFQGTLKQQGVPLNTTVNMTFSFVDGTGASIPGTSLISMANVQVTNGLFAVQLPISPTVNWQAYTPFIHVVVNNEVLNPDQPLTSNLYSTVSQTVVDNAITYAKLDPTTVQPYLIPPNAIMIFANACPTGWQVFGPLQGNFPIGAGNNTNDGGTTFNPGDTGGSTTHSHTTPNHQHTLGNGAFLSNASCGPAPVAIDGNGNLISVGGGSCGFNQASATTISGGSGNTGSASHLPPYATVVFCQKL